MYSTINKGAYSTCLINSIKYLRCVAPQLKMEHTCTCNIHYVSKSEVQVYTNIYTQLHVGLQFSWISFHKHMNTCMDYEIMSQCSKTHEHMYGLWGQCLLILCVTTEAVHIPHFLKDSILSSLCCTKTIPPTHVYPKHVHTKEEPALPRNQSL